ncbi:recombinase family protein [Marinobacter confluentis]|uniref:Resolvase n=1 Tax=Marinobacter confluentis TaxID=1697557 RepID=A0A4Z1C5I2_9GAMM|nr:helix-turn-helix domain-containing protein [Marinobacter confluentis]TGN41731.1 hypothetical protein E5Q11_04180 [Marinobacter confluentis]
MLIHAYLDAAASSKDLSDLKAGFETFARRKGHRINTYYNDREAPASRTNLFRLLKDKGLAIATEAQARAEVDQNQYQPREALFRLLGQARPNDVLLVASARTLGRLPEQDWSLFRQKIRQRKIRVVALDVEASWAMVTSESAMAPVAEQLTAMLLDTLEVAPPQAQSQRREAHLKGVARAREKGKYKGRPVNRRKHAQILALLEKGYSWSEVSAETGASRSTIARAVKSGG